MTLRDLVIYNVGGRYSIFPLLHLVNRQVKGLTLSWLPAELVKKFVFTLLADFDV